MDNLVVPENLNPVDPIPALYANEAVVWGCVDLLDAVDCSVEQPCGDDGYVLEQGDCAELNSIIAEHLPGWHPI